VLERVTRPGTKTRPEQDHELKRPDMYRVVIHNDHYTTMDFVVDVLTCVFRKTRDEAVRIMLHVHHSGVGVCGIYPHEIAETKVATVHVMAEKNGFPLKCSMEPE